MYLTFRKISWYYTTVYWCMHDAVILDNIVAECLVLVLPLCCWLLLQFTRNGSNMYTAGSSSFASLFLQKLEMLLSRSECCCWGFCLMLVFCSYTLIFCFSIHCCVMEGVLLIQSLIKLISAIMLSSWLCYRNVAKFLPRDAMHPRY